MKELIPNKNTFGVRIKTRVIKDENTPTNLITRINEIFMNLQRIMVGTML